MASDIFKSADWARGASAITGICAIPETEAQAIIRGARNIIADRERWTSGHLIDANGAMCLYGALMTAGGATPEQLRSADGGEGVDETDDDAPEVEGFSSYCEARLNCPWVGKAEPFLFAAANELHYSPNADGSGRVTGYGSMMGVNDSHGHEDMLRIMDRAYDLAGAKA